ncbi:MAG: hypothetical protein JSV82_02900 [Planctomycetota bacterium]|nr:MAG: hypothetical protein JSV82_02900 [Planctomycetota bacterium]
MENNANKDHEIELLKLEYQQCQSGYNSRDRLAEDEFCKVIQKFSVFLTILLAFNIFIKISPAFHFWVCVIIGIAGLCCLFSLLVVIESNSGCNVVLRQRCRQIEDRLKELTGFQIQYWQAIEDRIKYLEENIVKGIRDTITKRERKEQERSIFVLTIRLLILLWIIIVVAMIIWGRSISIKDLGGNNSSASTPPAKVSSRIDHRPVPTGYYCPAS